MFSYLFLLSLVTNSFSEKVINLDENNLVILKGPIDKTITNKFFVDVQNFNQDGNQKSLDIFISSPGGSVMHGMKIMDYIKTQKNCNVTVNCYADFAASMAFIILQSCTNRYALESAVLMQHQMSLGLSGPIENIKSYFKMIVDIENNLNDYQAQRIGLTYNSFNFKIYNDWWVSGFTAKNENVVDEIISLKCSFNLSRKKTTIEFNDFFGNIKLVFSKCPLIRNPIQVEVEESIIDNMNKSTYNNQYQEYVDMFNIDNYILNREKIKYYY